jgi:hypothetical protein
MALTGWLVLAAVCLLYVAVGLWTVAQIFPTTPTTTLPRDDSRPRKESAHERHRPRPR